jgi:hypothetical protein
MPQSSRNFQDDEWEDLDPEEECGESWDDIIQDYLENET